MLNMVLLMLNDPRNGIISVNQIKVLQMQHIPSRWLSVMLFLLLVLLPFSVQADLLEDVLESGKLRIGVSLFDPWVMRDNKGELVGFEIDVAERLAEDMGVKPEFRVYPWDEIIAGLQNNEIDIIIAGMAITPERALIINFSQPYAENEITLATNTSQTKDVVSLKQLNNAKYHISVVTDTISDAVVTKAFTQATIKRFTSPDRAAEAVVKGEVQAYVASAPQPELLAKQNPELIDMPLNKALLANKAGFAVNRGEQEMLNYLNSWIVARTADGWLGAFYKYWFKTLDWHK